MPAWLVWRRMRPAPGMCCPAEAEDLGLPPATRHEHAFDAIDRSRALLTASSARLDRSEAALRRAAASAAREQAEIDSAAAESGGNEPASRPTPANTLSARRRCARLCEIAAALAVAEDKIARVHDGLARHPENESEYRRTAEEARQAANQARELERQFAD